MPRRGVPDDQNGVVSMKRLHRSRQRLTRHSHGRAVDVSGPWVRPAVDHQGVEILKGVVVGEHATMGRFDWHSVLVFAMDGVKR